MAEQIPNSATAPAIGAILGLLMLFSGNFGLMAIGGLVLFGSGILLVVRLLALASRAASPPKDN